jgi:hypothetical protein
MIFGLENASCSLAALLPCVERTDSDLDKQRRYTECDADQYAG